LGDGLAVCVLVGGSLVGSASAQTINLWPGVAPGSESWKQKEIVTTDTPIGTIINNMVTPAGAVFAGEIQRSLDQGILLVDAEEGVRCKGEVAMSGRGDVQFSRRNLRNEWACNRSHF
jgi:hypothetical protein